MKLLIVDDSLIMRRLLERMMGRSRFTEIKSASNGRDALATFKDWKPDAVTMDLTMPEMDGLSTIDSMMEDNAEARILVISALADKCTAVEAIKRGAQGFLLKPIKPAELEEAIEDLLS